MPSHATHPGIGRRPRLATRRLDREEPGPSHHPERTVHRFAGRDYLVLSWTSDAFSSLGPTDRAIVERSGALVAPNGTRHLLMRAV